LSLDQTHPWVRTPYANRVQSLATSHFFFQHFNHFTLASKLLTTMCITHVHMC
jgi:hypothetical protein